MEKRKVCICCGESLPIEKFPTNRRMKDGHLGWCFDCFKHRNGEGGREYFQQKRAKIEAEKAARLARRREMKKAWAEAHKEKMREYSHRWYIEKKRDLSYREKRTEYMQEYRRRPEVVEKDKMRKANYYAANKEELCRKARERYRKRCDAAKM